jgi:hypothetical protein
MYRFPFAFLGLFGSFCLLKSWQAVINKSKKSEFASRDVHQVFGPSSQSIRPAPSGELILTLLHKKWMGQSEPIIIRTHLEQMGLLLYIPLGVNGPRASGYTSFVRSGWPMAIFIWILTTSRWAHSVYILIPHYQWMGPWISIYWFLMTSGWANGCIYIDCSLSVAGPMNLHILIPHSWQMGPWVYIYIH